MRRAPPAAVEYDVDPGLRLSPVQPRMAAAITSADAQVMASLCQRVAMLAAVSGAGVLSVDRC